MDSKTSNSIVTAIGIDIGKNTFHLVGLDERRSIVLRRKFSRGQVAARLANMAPCLVGMEACVDKIQHNEVLPETSISY